MTPPVATDTTSAWITAKHRIGIKLLLSVTGEAEAGSAGEQRDGDMMQYLVILLKRHAFLPRIR